MALFTSPRERRLWLWTLAVVLAIFASLGFAGRFSGFLRARGVLELSFISGFVLAGGAVAVTAASLLGLLDGGIQWILPDRYFDIIDVGVNALAALMAVAASVALSWAHRRKLPEQPGKP